MGVAYSILTFRSSRHSQKQLAAGDEIATCPSCSLIIRVVYDQVRSLDHKIPI